MKRYERLPGLLVSLWLAPAGLANQLSTHATALLRFRTNDAATRSSANRSAPSLRALNMA